MDFDTLKKTGWAVFFAVCFFTVMFNAVVGFSLYISLVVAALMLFWTLYLVYVGERYTTYMYSTFMGGIGSLIMCAVSVASLMASEAGIEGLGGFFVSYWPVFLITAMYVLLMSKKASLESFEFDGNKVQPRSSQASSMPGYCLPIVAGATTLGASAFMKAVDVFTSDIVIVSGLTACCSWLMYHRRHMLRGLRMLSIEQRNLSVPYTFMQIDEIRKARERWWLGRVLKWALSYRR
ncbi:MULTISPECIES: hypothetical protein [Pseudomonas syringae group]|uniref:hypothetical protein n=1 Tax=Pseudomonas syringae group TaxID=136849 RepID=UPI000F03FBC2|nr:hypothetical protein [Pseudomonas viridiflava]MBD8572388.1 hypothetical protein [Pseudomonas syringae]MEE4127496.1 hypothetical protein [Pseudomonas viridiflava]